jgi:ribosome biogenesis GTPase / thiamine phosphate phosphatase
VALWDGTSFHEAGLSGRLKADSRHRHVNPLAVGDEVDVESGDSTPLRVVGIRPRRTFLERATGDPRGRTQVIAANASQAVIVSSIADPPFRAGLVDRWALLAHRGGVLPILCLNKVDLGSEEEARRIAAEAAFPLESVQVSAHTGAGIEQLRALLADHTTVLVGHSGVGKSSLLRSLVPGADPATGVLSAKSGKGKHTTSSSRLYLLPEGGIVIDTPGVRSVNIGVTEVDEVSGVFREIAEAPPCKFRPCTHRAEPGCTVLAGVQSGAIPRSIYSRYRKLLEEVMVP